MSTHTGTPLEVAEDRAAGVAVDGRAREAGQLVVADADGVLHRVGDGAQARAQDDAHARRQVRAQARAGGLGALTPASSSSKASGSSSPMVVVCIGPPGRPRYTGVSGVGELLQALAAAAARRADVELLGDDGDGADLALAGGDHRADGRRLGALALRVGGVLDVGPDVDRPGAACAARRRPGTASTGA